MQSKTQLVKQYLLASDFDQTLSFHDSGLVLSELVGIPAREFERKTAILSVQNLVQQDGELAYLLLHDPEYRSRVRKEHLAQAGARKPFGLENEIHIHGHARGDGARKRRVNTIDKRNPIHVAAVIPDSK